MVQTSLSAAKQKTAEEEVYPLLEEPFETIDARCAHFDTCGGCQVQQLSYAQQLAFKRRAVLQAFAAEGLGVGEILADVAGMEEPWGYRNKSDFSVLPAGGVPRLGFTMAGARSIVEVEQCPISSPEINATLAAFREVLPDWGVLRRKLHSIIVRSSRLEGRAAVLYHTRLKDPVLFRQLSERLMERCPTVKGAAFVDRRMQVAVGETSLTERICGVDYTYSLGSFFQANPVQTETLVRTVLRLAEPTQADTAVDLFSGVGLFTLQLAKLVREVHAIEDTPGAVADARANAGRLGLSNCKFLRGQAAEQLEALDRFRTKVTLFVVDPPRSGCTEEALTRIARFAPGRLVYVSCNPVTLARDARALDRIGFRLTAVAPVDMFPQTTHVECAARFERR
ncbi:MAG: 23S rRNA (uracil(1939)-C(5))-methyltransferase RlmD [Candidatus Wallbacteria bacterium]|nr:23S rRNA (uracil(1939)-C(5))-methyltransferase RlmD [Candidatus Wallbacteria bacterium]